MLFVTTVGLVVPLAEVFVKDTYPLLFEVS